MTPAPSRRALPSSPTRRGWCPGLTRPMPTGDGLLARIHPGLGILTLPQARAVAAGARAFGNGHLDVTARANLQIRGVSEDTRVPLARLLEAAGLGDIRHDGGPNRLTLTSPLAGRDPAEVIDVSGLARRIEAAGRAIPGLPAKTLVAVEGRPGVVLPDADLHILATGPGRVRVAVASEKGPVDAVDCAVRDASTVVSGMLEAFVRSGRRRMRDLSDAERAGMSGTITGLHSRPPPESDPPPHPEVPASAGLEGGLQPASRSLEASFEAAAAQPHLRMRSRAGDPLIFETASVRHGGGPAVRLPAPLPPAGLASLSPNLHVLTVDAPFGRCTADALDRLSDTAEALGAAGIRLSPARGFVILVADAARAASALADLARDFIVAGDDPRRSVAACTGAPACASGSTPTLADAARVAEAFRPLAAGGASVHVSGCAKGCARPGPSDLTLVGRDGLYGAVVGGAPGEAPVLRLPIEAALERLGRAGTIGLAAAFAPDHAVTGCGRDGRPR